MKEIFWIKENYFNQRELFSEICAYFLISYSYVDDYFQKQI